MSYDKIENKEPNFERSLSLSCMENRCDNVNFLPSAKVRGVGDAPDLISEEAPPAAMLELSSDSDLQSILADKEIMEEDGGDNGVADTNPIWGEQRENDLPKAKCPGDLTKVPENCNDDQPHEKNTGNGSSAEDVILSVDFSNSDSACIPDKNLTRTVSRTANTPEAEERVPNCKYSDAADKPKTAAPIAMESSGRTLAPPGQESASFTVLRGSSHISGNEDATFPKDNKTSENNNGNNHEGNGACELLSRQEKERETAPSSHSRTSSKSPSRVPVETRRNQSRSVAKVRELSKSPSRFVEVRDRKSPVFLKSPDGKPVSPYLCKVFPVKSPKPIKGVYLPMNENQNRLLDGELLRALETERLMLLNAMSEYFSSKKPSQSLPRSASHNKSGSGGGRTCNDNESSELKRETYMSWMLKECHRESESEGQWNPLENIFRRSRSTQVSSKASLCDSRTRTQDSTSSLGSPSTIIGLGLDKQIHLMEGMENTSIGGFARRMYQSLKCVQKAIHLSDLFCFRNSIPEMALGESLSQPEFQQFMESENEIEILVNVMSLLGNARESIQRYMSAVQDANLVPGKGSALAKIGSNMKAPSHGIDNEEERSRIIPVTCPSCQSQIAVRVSTQVPGEKVLPAVHTFLEEQRNVTLSSYLRNENGKNRVVQLVMCDGHKYQIQFASTSEISGPIQGVITAKREYVGEPTYFTLQSLLSTIHRCTSYLDTRLACSCVWARQSKRFLLEIMEKYLKKGYRPATNLSWWRTMKMEGKMRQYNTFAGVIKCLTGELVGVVNKLHFCMQKSLDLLNKQLTEANMPGFVRKVPSSSDAIEVEAEQEIRESRDSIHYMDSDINDNGLSISTEQLYNTFKADVDAHEISKKSTESSSVEALLRVVAKAVNEIDSISKVGLEYASKLKLPSRKSRRVLRFMNVTVSQLGVTKDVEFGALVAAYLSAVDKMALFEGFMCEQKMEIRAKVNLLCFQIIQKLYDLRSLLATQRSWSANLAKNSFMKIKELNEIKRLRKEKKTDKHIFEKLERIRGSDASLRDAL